MKHLNLTILALLLSFASFGQVAAITGPSAVCIGSSITLTDATPSGIWSCTTGFATIGSLTGILTGVAPGIATVTYTVGTHDTTYLVTVNALPAPITGPSTVCPGSTITEAVAPTGGTWSISATSVATIGFSSGVITGVAAGSATITYVLGTGCAATKAITVSPVAPAIGGTTAVCVGGTGTLTDAGSGIWSSSNPSIATVGSVGGVVTGVSSGTTTISYTLFSGCSASTTVTVSTAPASHTVTGGGSYCAGSTPPVIGLDGTDAGVTYQLFYGTGPWSAPIAGTGSAISFDTASTPGAYTVVAHSVGGCSIAMTGSATLTIYPLPVAFAVTGGGSYCAGGAGVPVGLDNSVTGNVYQLYNGLTPVGAPVMGTGSALSFGFQTVPGVYTIIATNPATTCVNTMTGSVTVSVASLPVAYTIGGGGSYCAGGAGADITLSGSDVGVEYQLMSGGIAVGTSIAGTGLTIDFGAYPAGTYTIVATSISGCTSAMSGSTVITVNSLPAVYNVTGGGSYCSGGSGVHIYLSGSNSGISYQLMLGGSVVATLAGTGSGLDFGSYTTAGSYTIIGINAVTGCTNPMSGSGVIAVVATVTPSVAITTAPGDTVCSGSTVTFTAVPVSGGPTPVYSWTVGGTVMASGSTYSYVPATGDVVGITLTSSATCASPATATASVTMTVLPAITPSISISALPGLAECTATSTSYSTAITGGGTTPTYQWTVGGTPVTGATAGTYSYTPSSGDVVGVTMTSDYVCRTSSSVSTSVAMTIGVPTVTATATPASCGSLVTLTAGGASTYSWSPSTGLSCSTCATATLTPTATGTYTVTGTDGTGCTNTGTVSVDGNSISGYITYTLTPSAGDFKIWLIQFDPTDSIISSTDSTVNCVDGGVAYYQFMDEPSGSYMVKAKLNSSVPGTSGYIPTYGLSTPHWDLATTISHTGGADAMNIAMVYGTVPSGPGFISGYVASGAGRGTTDDIPAPGMLVYLKDASGNLITYDYTASDGTYSFSNLAYGTYLIYPETFKYYTTPSDVITLAPGSDSATSVDFKQHTSSGIITPYTTTKVAQLTHSDKGVSIYPNPTTGSLNIQWNNEATGSADVVITDVTGREALRSAFTINATSGQTQINTTGLNDGVYLLTIKSDKMYYSAKLVKQQ